MTAAFVGRSLWPVHRLRLAGFGRIDFGRLKLLKYFDK